MLYVFKFQKFKKFVNNPNYPFFYFLYIFQHVFNISKIFVEGIEHA